MRPAPRPALRRPARPRARLRPRPALRRRETAQRPRGSRRWWIAALLCAALALWFFWPEQQSIAPPPEPKKISAREPPPHEKAAPRAKPPPPKVAAATLAPAAPGLPDRDRLLAAIREKSAELAACPLPPRSPATLPVALRILKSGAVKSLRFDTSAFVPEELGNCARDRMFRWNFAALSLPRDLDVAVSFQLGKP